MAGKSEFSITWTNNKIPGVVADMDKFVVAALDLWAFGVIAASDPPVKTGGLKASGFRISSVSDTFGSAVGAMQGANPSATAVTKPSPPPNGVVLGFAASYAADVHYGHHTRSGSFVPGHPFFQSAVDAQTPALSKAILTNIKALLSGGSPSQAPGGA